MPGREGLREILSTTRKHGLSSIMVVSPTAFGCAILRASIFGDLFFLLTFLCAYTTATSRNNDVVPRVPTNHSPVRALFHISKILFTISLQCSVSTLRYYTETGSIGRPMPRCGEVAVEAFIIPASPLVRNVA
jgi:hypothetical protein